MANLFVLAFKNEDGANNALKEVSRLQKEELITLDDAAIVIHRQNGKVKTKQANSLVGSGAAGGAFWGLLFGLIFLVPFAGLAIGALSGALMGKLGDYGIDDSFIKTIGKKVEPGTSALFLLVRSAQRDRVVEALKPYGGELIQSSLSKAQETELKHALST